MSPDVRRPPSEQPLPRSQVVRSNWRQVILFAILTLILTVATVWGGRAGLRGV